MEIKELQELGLSEGEAEIYLALLKHGKASVMELAKLTGRHRTHIYDTIEKLKEKGLISESVIDNKKFILASSPENIVSYLKEKEEKAQKIIAELKNLEVREKEIKVETYHGISGLKAVFRDILKEKKDYVGYGEGSRFQKILPDFFEQFQGQAETLKIKLKLILKKGIKVPARRGLEVKHLDYISPSTTFIYADKVLIIIWEPFPTAIRIIDKQTADSYKGYFELLWKIAKH
jgi:sugar-specific transcriptional regulator TrmB